MCGSIFDFRSWVLRPGTSKREPLSNDIVHLLLIIQSTDTLIHGIPIPDGAKPSSPEWNLVADGDLIPWYSALFEFAKAYLEDDGCMVVFMPFGLSYELYRLAQKVGFEVKAEWVCNQAEPLVHPNFPHMMVRFCMRLHLLFIWSLTLLYKVLNDDVMCRHTTSQLCS